MQCRKWNYNDSYILNFILIILGETTQMGASSASSGGGTPDRNSRSQPIGTTDHGTSSPGQSEVDGQIQGSVMFSDSLVNSVLPGANSKYIPSISDRWHQSR